MQEFTEARPPHNQAPETPNWVLSAVADSFFPQTPERADAQVLQSGGGNKAPDGSQHKFYSSELPTANSFERIVRREGNRVFIPTFSHGDPDIAADGSLLVTEFDAKSPEAKLYLANRESVVKISVDRSVGNTTTPVSGSGFFVTKD